MAKITISSELKTKIIQDFKAGFKQKEICEKYDMNKSTICRIVKGYREKGTINTLHLGGRPRKTSQLQDQLIADAFKQSPNVMYKDVMNNFKLDISSRSIYRRVKQAEKTPAKTLMFDTIRLARLQFAKFHLDWPKENWSTAILSTFNTADQRKLTLEAPKFLENKNSYKKLKHHNEDTLIWACYPPSAKIAFGSATLNIDYKNILNDVRYAYVDENKLLAWRRLNSENPHKASDLVNKWIILNGVSVLNWPRESTDINPVEYLWKSMELNILTQTYKNHLELLEAIQLEWQKVSVDTIHNLIDSMAARCELALNNSGYPTPFTNTLTEQTTYENLVSDCQIKTETDDVESIIP